MAKEFTVGGFFIRWAFALLLVFGTYNPTDYCYANWVMDSNTEFGPVVALAGVVIILRPNLAELGWAVLLPLTSATFFALLMIANRASAGQSSSLAAQVFVAGICAPILLLGASAAKLSGVPEFDFGWPSWDVVMRCAFVAVTASCAHWLAYIGTARAGAAQVAPAIYVQMLVAVIMGWLVFDDIPDLYTVLGAGLIIAAGLYLWSDGLKTAQQAVAEPERS